MRSFLPVAFALISVAAPAWADDKPTAVKLQTNRGSLVSGTTEIKAIKVRSDLGTLEIPSEKIKSIQFVGENMGGGFRSIQFGGGGAAKQGPANNPAVTESVHRIQTTAGDTIVGIIESPEAAIVSDLGPLKIGWNEVQMLTFRPEPPKAKGQKTGMSAPGPETPKE